MTLIVNYFRQRIEEIQLAFSLLTRFPVPHLKLRTRASLTSAFWAYPIAGAAVGCFGAQIFWLAYAVSLGDMPAIILALCAMTFATGAFHEDGLADFWDAIGGGQSREQKLSIMRDSRLGTYGAVALILFFALNVVLLLEILINFNAEMVVNVLICISILARVSLTLPLISLFPARTDGMAVVAATPSWVSIVFGFALFVSVSIFLLGFWLTCVIFVGAVVGAIPVAMIAYRYLHGYTGDVLGATAMTAQTTALIAFLMGAAIIL